MMIFAGPFSPRFTADTLVVSVNVGEGGPPPPPAPVPGEGLCFPCEFVMIAKGRRGLDFGIGRARICGNGSSGRGGRGKREEGLVVWSKRLLWRLALRFGRPSSGPRSTLAEYGRLCANLSLLELIEAPLSW